MGILGSIDQGTVLQLSELAGYEPGRTVTRTLAQSSAVSVSVMALDTGQQVKTDAPDGDALLHVLTGNLNVTIGGKNHMLHTGQAIVAPAGMPHALTAPERVRLLRLVGFS